MDQLDERLQQPLKTWFKSYTQRSNTVCDSAYSWIITQKDPYAAWEACVHFDWLFKALRLCTKTPLGFYRQYAWKVISSVRISHTDELLIDAKHPMTVDIVNWLRQYGDDKLRDDRKELTKSIKNALKGKLNSIEATTFQYRDIYFAHLCLYACLLSLPRVAQQVPNYAIYIAGSKGEYDFRETEKVRHLVLMKEHFGNPFKKTTRERTKV